jgi:hypothetical protein
LKFLFRIKIFKKTQDFWQSIRDFIDKKSKQYTIRDALINKALEFVVRHNCLGNLTLTQCTLIAITDMRRGTISFTS